MAAGWVLSLAAASAALVPPRMPWPAVNSNNWTVLNNTDFDGWNLEPCPTVKVPSVQQCADHCLGLPNCVAVSWNGPGSQYHDNNCNFKCAAPPSGKKADKGEQAVVVRPGASTCNKPPAPPKPAAWQPDGWAERFAAATLLNSTLSDKSAQVGNGYLAFFVGGGTEHVAGLFNGQLSYSKHTTSHRADVPSALTSVAVTSVAGASVDPTSTPAAVDLDTATYMSVYRSADAKVECELRLYAHQARAHLLVASLDCNNTGSTDVTVDVSATAPTSSGDLNIAPAAPAAPGVPCWKGTIKQTETPNATPSVIGMCATDTSQTTTVTVHAGGTASLLLLSARFTNIDTDRPDANTSDPVAAAAAEVTSAAKAGPASLWASHAAAMATRVAPGIEVAGNPDLARAVNASLYALMCAVRPDVTFSTSPGGLATNAYEGHTFWDVETWMWPTFLAFHPDVARATLQYRVNRQSEARGNAALHNFSGMMFPWESAFSGTEVDPAFGTTTEEHLQGDIAFAFLQYFESTQDTSWLASDGFPVIKGIAEFWVSKAVKNANGTYSIPHIMGPDEYHGDVTNSVYCNVVAILSLRTAHALASVVGEAPNATYADVADNLVVLFDTTFNYHPEFSGYTRGTTIKQADTILLGYPLGFAMTPAVRANDLDYYANFTDVHGPAMTWSMFAVNYGDIGDDDTAAAFFVRGYQNNSLGAYHDWHEVVGASGADNFITGAGGFLQSVWAGYGGVRYANATMRLLRPRAPPGSSGLTLRGVVFRGVPITVAVAADGSWSVRLSGPSARGYGAAGSVVLQVAQDGSGSPPTVLTTVPVKFAKGTSATVSEKS